VSEAAVPEIVVTLNRALIEFKFGDAAGAEAFAQQLNDVVQTWAPSAQGVSGPFAIVGTDAPHEEPNDLQV
jgi:hypothetical protein